VIRSEGIPFVISFVGRRAAEQPVVEIGAEIDNARKLREFTPQDT
jgi:Asp-tRNA(Asn)/Glu-tRNA(Gln) amidotransferase A subunit family amidase